MKMKVCEVMNRVEEIDGDVSTLREIVRRINANEALLDKAYIGALQRSISYLNAYRATILKAEVDI